MRCRITHVMISWLVIMDLGVVIFFATISAKIIDIDYGQNLLF